MQSSLFWKTEFRALPCSSRTLSNSLPYAVMNVNEEEIITCVSIEGKAAVTPLECQAYKKKKKTRGAEK